MTLYKNGPKTLTDTSPKKIYRWKINIWKDAPHYIIKEVQTKVTVRYHYIPIRMATMRKPSQQMLVRIWSHRSSNLLLVGTGDDTLT